MSLTFSRLNNAVGAAGQTASLIWRDQALANFSVKEALPILTMNFPTQLCKRPNAFQPESLASSLKTGCNQIIHSPAPHFQESVFVGEVIRWLLLVALSAHSCLEPAKFPSAALAAALTRCVPWPQASTCFPGLCTCYLERDPKHQSSGTPAGPLSHP